MNAKLLKVQFKTLVSTGGAIEPAGAVHCLPEDQAKAYIARGLAVEVAKTAEEIEAGAKGKAAAEKKAKAETGKEST